MEINKEILSEINGATNIDSDLKEFLLWLLEFEKENLDKDRPEYKNPINKRINEILNHN